MDRGFIDRLNQTFDRATMAEVARRLKIPHATVRNYYKEGRLPAPEVLIKIAGETGVSLNWLLTGSGDVYAGQVPPIGLGKFLEQKIAEMIDTKFASHRSQQDSPAPEKTRALDDFDLEAAIIRFDEPERILDEWFTHEGRRAPHDLGLAFFRGWESFPVRDKMAAIRDAKKLLNRILQNER